MQIIKNNFSLIFTLFISILYLCIVSFYIFDINEFNSLKLSEKGDFLAGIFSPLAFLWLVYGYLQQGRELRLNSKALELQAIELKNSVNEQRNLIKIHENDSQIRQQQAKPILVFEHLNFAPENMALVSQNPFNGEAIYEHQQESISFHLKNLGSSIRDIEIVRHGELLKNIILLEKDTREYVYISLTNEEESELGKNGTLTCPVQISYTDMLGFKHLEQYKVTLYDKYQDDDGLNYYRCNLVKK